MINITVDEICKIVSGKLFVPTERSQQKINQIITDSRTFFNPKGTLFFALQGARNDGHLYIPELEKKGIKIFMVSDSSFINDKSTFILVKDTLLALQNLAVCHRKKFNYPVVGITGSNGKTIVKEWLHDLLATQFKIIRSPKSYNSQIGVPLSVLLMQEQYNLAIFEAGISLPGEMGNLERIISPEFGIFTNIGDAHQENFTSTRQKIKEKLRLFKHCKKIIYCSDFKDVRTEIWRFCERNQIQGISWSISGKDATVSFSTQKKNESTEIVAKTENDTNTFTIPFTNYSAIENACHCYVLSSLLLNDSKVILQQFGKLEPLAMRLEIKQGINNCILINDYYNSDLNSLAIALSVLQQQAAKAHLTKLIILSDIRQTGMPQIELYKQVNKLLLEWKIDRIIGIGPEISAHAETFTISKNFYPSREEFEKHFNRNDYNASSILMKGARAFTFEKISALLQQKAHQTVLEINMDALVHNLNVFRGLLKSKTKIMVMVKAFSYGSGDVEIAKLLQYQNVDYLAVAVADEGVNLRNAGIQTPIIVMNPESNSFQNILEYQLEPNIYSLGLLDSFLKFASQNGLANYPVHIKIDTGMNRLGLKSDEELIVACSKLVSTNFLEVKSVFSHLAGSDEKELDDFTNLQLITFQNKFELISGYLSYSIDRHILNSAGVERFTACQFEMVRLGIGLYGISCTDLPLQNIGTLISTISQIKILHIGETVGYGRKGEISKKSKIAVVPLGYADGLDRKLGNGNGYAFVRNKRVPIVGNICMDMLMLDVSEINAKTGDKVEFFGPNISINELAEKVETIPYEILTGISQRVKRIYLYD